MLQQMDYSYRAHHMWVRPVIPNEPSFYYKRNFASLHSSKSLVALQWAIEAGLEDNIVRVQRLPSTRKVLSPTQPLPIKRQMGNLTSAPTRENPRT